MTTFTAPDIQWAQLAPVIVVLGAAVVGVLVEAFAPQRLRRPVQLGLALAATAGALVGVAALWNGVQESGGVDVLGGSLLVDGPTLVLQGATALFALLSILVIADRTETGEDAFTPQAAAIPGSDYEDTARRMGLTQTEVYPLVLFATGGMLIFPATGDLLTLFVALEVLSLPLYLLCGLARRRRLLSQEAAMKYFLLGSFASAVMLFGIALLYGFAGSVRYQEIAAATATTVGLDGLLLTGAVMVLVGLLFKVGAVPFHAWTPDVYQGAPTPITAFMAACTKVAAFGALVRIVYVVLPDLQWDLAPALWTVAILTMVVGTVAALLQTDVKRMLAYSSIAHAGFVLTGIIALTQDGLASVLFYLLAYGAATIGAFAIVTLVRERSGAAGVAGDGMDGADAAGGSVLGEATHLSQWAGLGRTNPLLAGTFTLFLLSFAGIPLTAGFTGKFAVFSAAVGGGATALAVVGVLASAAAAFFYVRVIVLMFFTSPATDARDRDGLRGAEAASGGSTAQVPAASAATGAGEPATAGASTGGAVAATLEAARTTTTVVASEGLTTVAVAICAVLTLVLGVVPGPVLDVVADAARLLP
ncbi:NADH-quinone oxidoreductase subunit NuoN [Cellulomonas cellasea]|uniref:NADH-quinone oxidoreductase subunit N n=2 Tax=Cellulomonas cellasea TaxID=43670 RepID=A0A0A0B4P8_9CELL|nr:NADH-quinone oxidoreductase subunit NuoN [Cellulomonas cellasea]KGM00784.1 NADH:ubiquinone oxidoreductase subunit N [Cellulomonas cellasea DSM 20118]GEA86364.1 NADH-quinone oxidoreductase subunit N [Cellulomonas cellasea]